MCPLDNGKLNYIWNSEWILPYESLWNIVEKFRYINCIKSFKIPAFKTSYHAVYTKTPCDKQNYIYPGTLCYSANDFPKMLGIGKKHFSALSMLYDNDLYLLMDKKIKICPECICQGYHSFFHQLLFMDKCFLHKGISLKKTDILYALNYSPNFTYGDICNFQNSFELLDILTNKRQHLNEQVHSKAKYLKIIIPEYSYAIFDHNIMSKASHLISTIFWENSYYPRKPLWKMSKTDAKARWENYFRNKGRYFINTWLTDYCYNYSNKIKEKCNVQRLEMTQLNFNSSYLGREFRNKKYKYDADCIAAILTAAILTGYNGVDDITYVYSSYWEHKRNQYCFCKNQFNRLINQTIEPYRKTAYIELYKILVQDLYLDIYKRALSDEYSKKHYIQLANPFITKVAFYIVETDNSIGIYRI